MSEFKMGDVVRIKGDTQKMTVAKVFIGIKGILVECQYFNKLQLCEEFVALSEKTLEKVSTDA